MAFLDDFVVPISLIAGTLISGRDLKPSEYGEVGETPYLTGASNFRNGQAVTNRFTNSPQVISFQNDVLITCKGTIGKVAVNSFTKCHIARQIMAFRCNDSMLPVYAKWLFTKDAFRLRYVSNSLIPGFDRNDFLSMTYPHESTLEQKRVAESLNKMVRCLERISLEKQ